MRRFRHKQRTHGKRWFAAWALVLVSGVALAQWRFDSSNPLVAQVLGAQAKKPGPTPPSVDTVPPSQPVITSRPENPTFDNAARFAFTHDETGISYECRLDGQAARLCGKSISYNTVDVGEHTFAVVAIDAAGNRSPAATYAWTVLENKSFEISGTLSQQLFPGATRALDLVLGNPYNFPITVTSVTVVVRPQTTSGGAPNPACLGTANLEVSRQLATSVTLAARARRTLGELAIPESQWPQLHMPNLPVNQDACKNTTFQLAYTGSARKP